ncbi:MAG: YolD-like family protein [Clostridia bacterium]|nr:YolD-like family protein [Clostridia bacterium]
MNSDFTYDDIIRLPRHRSRRRSPMPRLSRAAQFAPFAALSGYESAVEETARLTESARELDEESLALMDEKLHALLDIIRDQPEVTITYFEPDVKKAGGAYLRATGRIRRIDEVNRQLILTDRTVIAMDRICGIDCPFSSDK